MHFFLRLPFNQLKACPSELPGFFCPRWALASRAKISVMSLGTRSPVDLLRDIMEVLGAKARYLHPDQCVFFTSQRIRNLPALQGWMNPSVPQCLCFFCQSPPGITMKSAGWERERDRGRDGKTEKYGKNGSQREDRVTWEARTRRKKKRAHPLSREINWTKSNSHRIITD